MTASQFLDINGTRCEGDPNAICSTGESHSISLDMANAAQLLSNYTLEVSVEYNRGDICVDTDGSEYNAAGE